MALSVMPCSVMAESSLTLKSFNATKSAITMDFVNATGGFVASEVKSKFTIYKNDGTEIVELGENDFTVETTGIGDATDTIVIKPIAGIDTDSFYKAEENEKE